MLMMESRRACQMESTLASRNWLPLDSPRAFQRAWVTVNSTLSEPGFPTASTKRWPPEMATACPSSKECPPVSASASLSS